MNHDARASLFQSDSIAENYRHYLLPTVFEPWARLLVTTVAPQPGVTILDVASGTGAVARAAATAVGSTGRVIASDISTGMLAQVSIGADPSGAPIETLEAPATSIALDDDSVDVSIITILDGPPKTKAPRNPVKIMRNALPMAIMRVRRAAVPTLTHTLSSCAVRSGTVIDQSI